MYDKDASLEDEAGPCLVVVVVDVRMNESRTSDGDRMRKRMDEYPLRKASCSSSTEPLLFLPPSATAPGRNDTAAPADPVAGGVTERCHLSGTIETALDPHVAQALRRRVGNQVFQQQEVARDALRGHDGHIERP